MDSKTSENELNQVVAIQLLLLQGKENSALPLHPPCTENEAHNASLKDPDSQLERDNTPVSKVFFPFPLSDGRKAAPCLPAACQPSPP